jgi:hypothetical protein
MKEKKNISKKNERKENVNEHEHDTKKYQCWMEQGKNRQKCWYLSLDGSTLLLPSRFN